MISIRKILLIASLALVLIVTDIQSSWAVNLPVQEPVIMNLFGKSKAAALDAEGKTQETMGKMTGNKKEQATTKAKQVESKGYKAAENIQDTADNVANKIKRN